MSKPKSKEYVLETFPDIDTKSRFFAGFRYDSSFFMDINELIQNNDLDYMIDFPVDDYFFEIYEFKSWTSSIDYHALRNDGFSPLTNKLKVTEFISSIRLYVFHQTFHFGIKSVNGINLLTNDFTVEFIEKLKMNRINQNTEVLV